MKIVKPRTGGSIDPTGADWTSTYYVYDAEGVVLATYSQTYDAIEEKDYLHLSQNYIYGLQRLGHLERDLLVAQTGSLGEPGDAGVRKLGAKAYELSNHLGNVLATVSDRKFGVEGAPTLVEYYEADILSYSDYYPFGMQMPGRNASTGDYRYGFNGQETDDEITGSESHVSYKYRIHDARLGRFLSIDPLVAVNPGVSGYSFAANTPIWAFEFEGLLPVTRIFTHLGVTYTFKTNTDTPQEFSISSMTGNKGRKSTTTFQ
jgi:RHS repeat-associated protein